VSLFIFKTFYNLLKVLNSERNPAQLAAAVAFGMMIGFSPFVSLHNLVIFLLVCLFRVNLTMFFVSLGVFKIFAFVLDPVFDLLGYGLLVDFKAMRPLWIAVTSGPIWPYFRFNNTIVIGSLVFGVIAWIPVYLGALAAVRAYRQHWREYLKNSKLLATLKTTPFYSMYLKYESFKERMSVLS
jgi:uncharacterized protein (TIGR03546 family)